MCINPYQERKGLSVSDNKLTSVNFVYHVFDNYS